MHAFKALQGFQLDFVLCSEHLHGIFQDQKEEKVLRRSKYRKETRSLATNLINKSGFGNSEKALEIIGEDAE